MVDKDKDIGRRAASAIWQRIRETKDKQYQVLSKMFISRENLNHWKNGKSRPAAFFLQQMALNGYDVVWIVTGKRDGMPTIEIPDGEFAMEEIGKRAAQYVKQNAARKGIAYTREFESMELTGYRLHDWENKHNPSALNLATLAMHGYDILWILTGEERASCPG